MSSVVVANAVNRHRAGRHLGQNHVGRCEGARIHGCVELNRYLGIHGHISSTVSRAFAPVPALDPPQ